MKNLPRSGLAAPGEVCFSFLERGGEFESSRLPKTAKTAVFASLVRYFYFTPPNSSGLSKLFLFLSKPCSFCTKNSHKSAGFLLASRLSTKLGTPDWIRTSGLQSRSFLTYKRKPCICSTFSNSAQTSDQMDKPMEPLCRSDSTGFAYFSKQ